MIASAATMISCFAGRGSDMSDLVLTSSLPIVDFDRLLNGAYSLMYPAADSASYLTQFIVMSIVTKA
jgi:hypothetical protein